MSRGETTLHAALDRWERGSLLAAAVAWIVCLLAAFLLGAPHFFRAYLAAYLFFLGISLGSMALLMLYHLTGGAWGYLIRRILESQISALPSMAALALPLAFGLPSLYRWAQPEEVARSEKLQSQQFYLNPEFFLARAAIYFLIWLLIAWRLLARSRQQGSTGDPSLRFRLQRLSEVGLVVFGTTMHFAAFDWVEMLQPNFHSTIFPMLVVAGQLLSAQALAILVFVSVSLRTEAAEVASMRALNDLGNMLLTFVIIWSYLFWFQFLLGWMANQSSDALWILPRSRGGWLWVTWVLVVFHFIVPLCLLLLRSVKRNPAAMRWIAGLLLVMQLIYDNYLTTPAFTASRIMEQGLVVVTPVAIGGLWLAWFLRRLRLQPALVEHDPNRERALHLRQAEQEEWTREEAVAHA